MIRALTHDDPQITDTVCLLEWCREYQRRGPHPRPALERFCIGTYQISQALGWGIAGPVAWQSYCAACLHFLMAAEGMELYDDRNENVDAWNEAGGISRLVNRPWNRGHNKPAGSISE